MAIEIGNTRVKLGWFPRPSEECAEQAARGALPIAATRLPEPAETLTSEIKQLESGAWNDWRDAVGIDQPKVFVASVCRPVTQRVVSLLDGFAIEHLVSQDAPIELRVEQPTRIGVDRVLAAVAANQLRRQATPAIVVDIGTAITVDLIATDGALEGGAILPGPSLAARSLADHTDALPEVPFGELQESPEAVGRSTEPAIRAGVFWGAVGAIRELIARQRDRLATPPQVFLTGGAAPSIARLIGGPDLAVRRYPNLTLSGVAIAAASIEQ